MGFLYCLIFPDGKKYIGVTMKSVEARFRQHVARSRNARTKLSIAIKEYGEDSVRRVTLAVALDAEYLKAAEIKAIEVYQTGWPFGYNSTIGGDGVYGLSSEIEIGRRKKLSATHTNLASLKRNREIQNEYWTQDRRKARSDDVKKMWADPVYREKLLLARKKPVQRALNLPKNRSDVSAKMRKKYWDNPEYRDAARNRRIAQLADPAERKRLSERQLKVMRNASLREQIAHSMSKYRNAVFIKSGTPRLLKKDRGGLLQNTIPLLPNPFTALHAIGYGWQGREFDKAVDRGWIERVRCENF